MQHRQGYIRFRMRSRRARGTGFISLKGNSRSGKASAWDLGEGRDVGSTEQRENRGKA